jgi:Tol biopolymer transport system component
MGIATGTRFGSYEVVSQIGAGGMGEVYEARDTKLGRNVAIKVLPDAFAHDADRLVRFQREARALAALNHPNIATIHGLEQSNGTSYLVMELVPGETLSSRIKRERALPVEEAVSIAKQIAEALESAHEKGIIHRDLKPSNVKVTPEGRVKVLDFGLAKAFTDDSQPSDPANSPTLSAVATTQGVIMGTAAYMSPEQVRGKAVDKRTDIWAFGCVLYEMLTGKRAFDGEDVTEILAAVVKAEPAFEALPKNISPSIRVLLQRCLRKDRRQRTPDAGTIRIEIEDAIAAPKETGVSSAAPAAKGWRERAAWAVAAGVLIVTTIAFAIGFVLRVPRAPEAIRFFISPPDTWSLMGAGTLTTGPISVSPDGHRIVFLAATADGKSILWVRSMDTLSAQALAGTEGALRPFWSPDSRFVGFFASGKLKKIDVSGGPPITLCDAPEVLGGTWNREGVIVFSPAQRSALQKVSAAGGVPTTATVLGQGESIGHRMPFFLPDGRHFLYRAVKPGGGGGPVYVASLDSSERKFLLNSDSSNVLYTQGHLLFLRETTLMAQPFDPRSLTLTGEAFPVAEQIQTQGNPPAGVFSASENGVLAYQTGSSPVSFELTWFDRSGKKIGILGDRAVYGDLELAPDGKRASVSISNAGSRNIWIYDVARSLKTRYTFDAGNDAPSIWSPDGSRLVFSSNRKGHFDLYQNVSDGSATEAPLLEDNFDKLPNSWSPDGRIIIFTNSGGPTGSDLFVLPLTGDRKPVPFLKTQFNESDGRFSPDGRWVAYRSNESGTYEIYVAPFPGPGGKRQISTGGGTWPRWRRDGTEIFYVALDNKLMVAAVNGKGSSFEVGTVKPLFDMHVFNGLRYPYDLTPDGQRFLLSTVPGQASSAPITVVVNWLAGLKK